jgi:hypothetical protein
MAYVDAKSLAEMRDGLGDFINTAISTARR